MSFRRIPPPEFRWLNALQEALRTTATNMLAFKFWDKKCRQYRSDHVRHTTQEVFELVIEGYKTPEAQLLAICDALSVIDGLLNNDGSNPDADQRTLKERAQEKGFFSGDCIDFVLEVRLLLVDKRNQIESSYLREARQFEPQNEEMGSPPKKRKLLETVTELE